MKRLVVGLVMGALVMGSSATLAQDGGTLAAVQARGSLVCGVNGGLPGMSVLNEATGQYDGMDADFCRAVAAAVLGDPNAVEYRPLTADQRATAIQGGEVDVIFRNTTNTISRDATWGDFGPTIFYDGQGMMVRADLGATTPGGPRRGHHLRDLGHDHRAEPDRPDDLPGRGVHARRLGRDRHGLRPVRGRPLRRGHLGPLPAGRPQVDLRQPGRSRHPRRRHVQGAAGARGGHRRQPVGRHRDAGW